MASKKINRHELQEDVFFDNLMKIKDFSFQYRNQIMYGVIGAVVIVAGVFFIMNQKSKREAQAVEALGGVEMLYYQNQTDQVIVAGEDMIQKYNDTPEAGLATIILANSYYSKGEFEKAQQKYEAYLKDNAKDDLYGVAALEGWANCLVQSDKYQEAAEKYQEAADKHNDSYAVPFLLEKSAACYQKSGDLEKAKTIYQKIIQDFPEYPQLDNVKVMIGQLS